MRTSRRQVLQGAATAALLGALPGRLAFGMDHHGGGDGPTGNVTLTPFVDPLPLPRVLEPVGSYLGRAFYRVTIDAISQKLHRDLPPTRLWGYDGSFPGPTIRAVSNEPVYVQWVNRLPVQHLLHVAPCLHGPDHFLHMAGEAAAQVSRAVTHLHGAKVPPASDGYPEDYLAPPGAPGHGGYPDQATTYYPNIQNAATLWYHDHALGMTRLNVMAGLAGFYLLQDPYERSLRLPKGPFDVPLAIQDRSFHAEDGYSLLAYPADFAPEFFGDHFLVNGVVFPYLEVGRGLYRLRLLNGCNSRFLRMTFAKGTETLPFWVIATEQGLLPTPVPSSTLGDFVMGPGERVEILIDFDGCRPGDEIILTNDAPTPYPRDEPLTNSPMTRIMQFRVTNSQAPGIPVPKTLMQTTRQRVDRATTYDLIEQLNPADAKQLRKFWLFEQEPDPDGCAPFRSVILTEQEYRNAPNTGGDWDMVAARPELDSIEVWEFYNTTPDAHPIHLHLVQFQVIGRAAYDFETDSVGPALPLDPAEAGWKDTTKVHPGEKVTIIARFEGFTGKYPFHCHILEHEDHEMMRQFEVVPAAVT